MHGGSPTNIIQVIENITNIEDLDAFRMLSPVIDNIFDQIKVSLLSKLVMKTTRNTKDW